jgi:NAD(P)H-flavin reductase
MPTPSYTLTCLSKKLIAKDVYELKFSKPEGLIWKPGQYLLFDIPLIENPTDIQTRAFSIASTAEEPELLFVIRLLPGGRASRWVEEVAKEGTEVRVQGPFGRLIIDPTLQTRYIFAGTSTGVAPFRTHIVSLLQAQNPSRVDLVFGVRTEADIFWKEEFEALAQKHPALFLHITLSQPSPEWQGHTGRIQSVLEKLIKEATGVKLYACGNPQMTLEVKKLALEQWGLQKMDVHVEGYI